jgi:hypothetical protein
MTGSESIPRRDFARALAAAAVVAPGALADEPKGDEKKDKPREAPKPPDEVDARMALLLARFGKHAQLDEKARAAIREEVAGVVRRAEVLRKVPLGNGDGPFPVFHPYRGPLP